jgi:Outer membrane protein beta-barrel domain
LRKLVFLALVLSFLALTNFASAQQGDAMIGFGAIASPGAYACGTTSSTNFTCPEKGGLYINAGGDVIFHRRIGIGFDAAWRASQGLYPSTQVPYRPIIFDFNGVYQPRLSKKIGADLMGGIGWQDTRYYGYTPTFNCNALGACYNSSNHFLVDIGAGVRYYFFGHVFARPEAHYYRIFNNTADYTSDNVFRLGVSIGYTIGGD